MRRTFGKKSQEKDVKTTRVLAGLTSPTVRACRVYNSGNFTHNSSGNYLAITFDSERSDIFVMHSTVTNSNRITISTAGWYLVWGGAQFTANATGVRRIGIRLDGATYIAATNHIAGSASEANYLQISTLYYFDASSYIELMAYQNSGGNLDIIGASNFTPEFAAIYLGA